MKAFLFTLLLATPLYAQSVIELTGTTSAGDPIAVYQDKKYIMFDLAQVTAINDKLDRLAQLEVTLPICQRLNRDYEARLATAIKQSDGWKSLFDTEHALRLDMAQFQNRPSRFTSWMDKPLAKLLITFGPPVITAIKR